ncbi:MAG: hypothetical protein JW963_04430 [Anaerolineales bacterium]|nr:hypothetical protein [Anaerolineales bacterium]
MKRTGLFLLILVSATAAEVERYGFVETDVRVLTNTPHSFSFSRNTFNAGLRTRDAVKVGFHGELEVVIQDIHNVSSLADLQDLRKLNDIWVELRGIYIDMYGFILPGLDLRVGHQIEKWGTADLFNPTDYLNPYDFSDPFDFGRKLANTMFKATYYFKSLNIAAVVIPVFKPARLPDDVSLIMSSSEVSPIPGMSLETGNLTVDLPDRRASNMAGGAKIGLNAFGIDFSTSYFYGREQVPLPVSGHAVMASAVVPPVLRLDLTLEYPKIHVVGLDFAGAIGNIGVWGEGALVIPHGKTVTEIVITTPMGDMPYRDTVLDDEPFLKGVLGLDYTFKWGIYTQIQYLRGFIAEMGPDNIGDYVMIAAEKSFLHDELTLRLAGGIEIREADKVSFFTLPEISYKPGHGLECAIGAHIIKGQKGTTFFRWDDKDEAYLRINKSF